MTKKNICFALILVALFASGCTKESFKSPTNENEELLWHQKSHHITYWIDGESFTTTLQNEVEITDLFRRLTNLALSGHQIHISNDDVGTGWMNRVVWVETGVSGLGPCLPTTSVPMNDNPIEVYVSFMPIVTGVINAPTHTGSNPILQRGIHTICQ